jgi:hypothetical protein
MPEHEIKEPDACILRAQKIWSNAQDEKRELTIQEISELLTRHGLMGGHPFSAEFTIASGKFLRKFPNQNLGNQDIGVLYCHLGAKQQQTNALIHAFSSLHNILYLANLSSHFKPAALWNLSKISMDVKEGFKVLNATGRQTFKAASVQILAIPHEDVVNVDWWSHKWRKEPIDEASKLASVIIQGIWLALFISLALFNQNNVDTMNRFQRIFEAATSTIWFHVGYWISKIVESRRRSKAHKVSDLDKGILGKTRSKELRIKAVKKALDDGLLSDKNPELKKSTMRDLADSANNGKGVEEDRIKRDIRDILKERKEKKDFNSVEPFEHCSTV